jgi:hypothetical protein
MDPMKFVEFTRDMAPHVKGETRLIIDDALAKALIETGTAVERPLPPGYDGSQAIALQRPGKRYPTRGRA